jgi:tetratricopeptide (TPR) repeat protein
MGDRRSAVRFAVVGLLAVCLAAPAFAQDADAFYEFLMARRLESAGDMAGALAALVRAAAADPDSAEVQAEIASFHLRRNDREDAEVAGRAALVLDGDNVEAHRVLGLLIAAYADRTRTRSPADAREYAEEAIDHLERAIDSPAGATDIGLQYTLGRLYLRIGLDDEAVTVLGNVVEENPGSVQARLTLGQAHAALGNLDGAIDTLQAIVRQAPRVSASLGQYQEQAGRFLDAAESYTAALELTPDNRELKFRRIIVLFNAERFGDVASLSAEASAEYPEDGRFARMRARGLFESGDRDEAYAVIQAMVAANPGDASLQMALADLYYNGDRGLDAERTLRRLVAAEPMNAGALNYLGYLLADEGRELDEAVALVLRALKLDPGNPSFLDSLGWAYYRRGELDAAGQYLEPAAEQLPDNSVILDHLGDLRFRQGRWDDAVAAWQQALDGDGGDIDRATIEQKIDDARAELQDPQ